MVIYGDIVVNFLIILRIKSIISQKLRNAKIGKLFFHRFRNIAHPVGQKEFGHFWSFNLVNFLSILVQNKTFLKK